MFVFVFYSLFDLDCVVSEAFVCLFSCYFVLIAFCVVLNSYK